MTVIYDAIYLAPHLDDAALSCGGRIAAQTDAGARVLILTLMAGEPAGDVDSPIVRELHIRWELLGDAVARRRTEDEAACAVLGADCLHWEIPDCIYRVDGDGRPHYPTEQYLFGPVAAAEASLLAELSARLSALPAAQVFAPLAVGGHVDHQLTRAAAEASFGASLWYYEDYPYVSRPESNLAALTGPAGWQAEAFVLSAANIDRKIEGVSKYASQISTFFRDNDDLAAQIGDYAAQVGGERYWRRRQ